MGRTAEVPNIFGAYRFRVEIEGLQVAGFNEVTGLQMDIETFEYREGGVNFFVHHFPVITKYQPLELKRGISDSASASALWDWFNECRNGKVSKKDGSIILNDQAGNEYCRWNFFGAIPVMWKGPELNSIKSEIAIESIQLVHEGLKLIYETDYSTGSLFD